MSKAILVIDMPDSCYNCSFREYDSDKNEDVCLLKDEFRYLGCISGRDEGCPLKELPEKKEMKFLDDKSEFYRQGYNACLNEILKQV